MSEEDDDFGDFDDFEEFQEGEDEEEVVVASQQVEELSIASEKLPALHESDFNNSAQLQTRVLEMLNLSDQQTSPARSEMSRDDGEGSVVGDDAHTSSKAYFSQRSESLWNQLAVIAPEVHPIDWKRSAIRRLLLVSMGVPLDLDEILPKKNTKRLILPTRDNNKTTDGRTPGSGSAPSEESSKNEGNDTAKSKKQKAVDALISETDDNLTNWYQLASVSVEAVEGMDGDELEQHTTQLKQVNERAKQICGQWEQQRDAAKNDKEAFEAVIERLVDYAQRKRR